MCAATFVLSATLATALTDCNFVDEFGQRQIWAPDCTGAGCLANDVDSECAWCVYDVAQCEKVHGNICEETKAARDAEGVICPVPPQADDGNCFVPLVQPLESAPFDDEAVKKMRQYFFRNFNINGTGGIVAAAGYVPALPAGCCAGGYTFHWMRDGALSMMALQDLIDIDGTNDEATTGRAILAAYVGWVKHMQENSDEESAHVEPKWDMKTLKPYTGGWCRPQTDGPPLRAQALMHADRWATGPSREELWPLIKFDLDWVARGNGTITLETCDLWEETVDPNFLWNRVSMRKALLEGHDFAKHMGDHARATWYLEAVAAFVGNPALDHLHDAGFLTECPASGGTDSCMQYNKSMDGAVLLSLIHGGWQAGTGLSTDMMAIASTVEVVNRMFCRIYEVNRADSSMGIPGVLMGRYENDAYGGGNPWVLLTSTLASLFYQVAQYDGPFSTAEIEAWGRALNIENFTGTPSSFIAAGDAVLSRLHAHVVADDFRLFEQIDRLTGKQYNAEDLTWSYAETLTSLRERNLALDFARRQPVNV